MSDKTVNIMLIGILLIMATNFICDIQKTSPFLRGGYLTRIQQVLINNRDNVLRIQENERKIGYLYKKMENVELTIQVLLGEVASDGSFLFMPELSGAGEDDEEQPRYIPGI